MDEQIVLTIIHQKLIQYFMAHKTVKEEQLLTLYKIIKNRDLEKDLSEKELMDKMLFDLHDINEFLFPLGLEIKKGVNEFDETTVFCLVNLISDEISRLATGYSQTELRYLYLIIEGIVYSDSPEFGLGNIKGLDLKGDRPEDQNSINKLTKSEKECLLESFIEDGWLDRIRGYLVLTTRTLLELQSQLLELYSEKLELCYLCERIVTKGVQCINTECDRLFHDPCLKPYFLHVKKRNLPLKCPKCKADWNVKRVGFNIQDQDSE